MNRKHAFSSGRLLSLGGCRQPLEPLNRVSAPLPRKAILLYRTVAFPGRLPPAFKEPQGEGRLPPSSTHATRLPSSTNHLIRGSSVVRWRLPAFPSAHSVSVGCRLRDAADALGRPPRETCFDGSELVTYLNPRFPRQHIKASVISDKAQSSHSDFDASPANAN